MNQPPNHWTTAVVSAIQGLEAFFWRVAWFALFVYALFGHQWSHYSSPKQQEVSSHGDPAMAAFAGEAVREESPRE